MALPPIEVQLTDFEKIEILRHEIDLREEEINEAEKTIRRILYEIERNRYLSSIHALFQQLPQPEEAAQMPQLQANREGLQQAVVAMKMTLKALESKAAGVESAQAARSPGATEGRPGAQGGQRVRFDTFDDFRKKRQGSQ